MRHLSIRSVVVTAVVAGWALLSQILAAQLPLLVDSRVLAMIPAGAELAASVMSGQPASYLVMTVNNTMDLTDFQSITGADPQRVMGRVVFVTTSSHRGPQHEHSLVASGQFDFGHITKSALENGAAKREYRGLPVLIFQPLERDRTISQDVRWLAAINPKILVFGSIPLVQEEVDRYLDASPPDVLLAWRLSRLHHGDQSWCVMASFVRRTDLVRRALSTLDLRLADPEHANDALVVGIHFGRNVEIEYENEPDSLDPRQVATQAGAVDDPQPGFVGLAHAFRSANEDATDYHVLRVSRKEYDAWIERQGPPGDPPPRNNQLIHKKHSRGGKSDDQR